MKTHTKLLFAVIAAVLGYLGVKTSGLLSETPASVTPAAAVNKLADAKGFRVAVSEVDDLKSVFATVRSRDRIEARVRIPGTIAELKTDEGREVAAGELLAIVADPKIALKLGALDAQIEGARSRSETAKAEMERTTELLRRGIAPQSRFDQAKTAYDTAINEVKSAQAERDVTLRQMEEGKVLAPAAGRVLRVPVTVGSVVMAGESVATIAANAYLLRMELPERHARFLKVGDTIKVGSRGLTPDQEVIGKGKIVQVYPELQGGRVIADAEAEGLGNFFVGERVLAWINAGKRRTIVIPAGLMFSRFGLDYVRIAGPDGKPLEVVVQRGQPTPLADGAAGIEILSGLNAGDVVLAP